MREDGAGPLGDAATIRRAKAGLGCMCRHEWMEDWGRPHCDGPLTRGGGGLCWTCKVIRRCGNYVLKNQTTPGPARNGSEGRTDEAPQPKVTPPS